MLWKYNSLSITQVLPGLSIASKYLHQLHLPRHCIMVIYTIYKFRNNKCFWLVIYCCPQS